METASWKQQPFSDNKLMDSSSLFTAALRLQAPWKVIRTEFTEENGELHLYLDFPRGSKFGCPTCHKPCPVHDTDEKIWRHLDFFQHKAFLHARVPRAKCEEHGVLQAVLPWSRPDSGFTLLFESLLTTLATAMPVVALARWTGEQDTRIWRSIRQRVEEARSRVKMSAVNTIGVDETSVRKRHKYLTIFADIATSRVLFATPGKDGDTFIPFLEDFIKHGGRRNNIKEVSIDMSPAFIKGVADHLPQASITFDKFHVTKLVLQALEDVRRSEQRESPKHYDLLKQSRFTLLTNPDNMSKAMVDRLERIKLSRMNLKTARAWRLKEGFRYSYNLTGKIGEKSLSKWCSWAVRSNLQPMKEAALTIRKHWEGVIGYFKSRVTNAVLESINASFQAARAKARGYRNPEYAKTILYLIAGGLDLPNLNKTHSK